MTSMQGYNQSTDLTFMYDIQDLRSNGTIPKFHPDSITGFIFNNPEFSLFKYLLTISQNDVKYSQGNAYFTFFIASDDDILQTYTQNEFMNMDLYTARQIVLYSTISKIIHPKSLTSLKDLIQVNSRIDDSFLTIKNLDGPIYINGSRIKAMKECNNGIIYIIDKMLVPPAFYE